MQRESTNDYGLIMNRKVSLVAGGTSARSLREYGGLYIVLGKYLLEPAVLLGAELASMVDVTPRPEWQEKVDRAIEQIPHLKVEFEHGDFRESILHDRLRPVDTSILFEVLLHQENYVEILRRVTRSTTKYLCIAQPCLKEDHFKLPASATLLQFWPEDLKSIYREGGFWPPEPETETFDTRYWMWGHSTSHIVSCLKGFGWKIEFGEVYDDVCGPNWEYALLRFVRSKPS